MRHLINTILIMNLLSLLSLSSLSSANELGNPGFEDNTSSLADGNNFAPAINISPWAMSSGAANVVRIDGAGGSINYGNNGPEFDASSTPPGNFRHYLDMSGGQGSFYQAFTTPEECSGEVRFGGFFSTRGNANGQAHIEIRSGTGESGTLIGTTSVINVPFGNSQTTPWTPVNFSTTLSAGTTYSLVIWMDNQLNFDEGYVNFVEGPCKDDSDLVDPEPEQCLVLEPKVECVANKWQVSITNSSSLDAGELDISSLTNGVTISGASPNWILNGALPNSAVDISVDGTVVGGGSAEFSDLCCSTELHIDIPDEECEIKEVKPHIYTRKSFEETEEGKGIFHFVLDSWEQLNAPTTLTITDTIPTGVTLTSLDSSNVSNWSCPGLPMSGPASLVCTYIGTMPIPAWSNFDVKLHADITPSKETRENCIKTNLIDTDGLGIPYDGNQSGCVEIPPEEEIVGGEKPELETTKICEFLPKMGLTQVFTCKITVTGTNFSGSGDINLTDLVTDTVIASILGFSSDENWGCDTTPVMSPTPFNCSISEADFLNAGGTSEILITGSTQGSASTMDNCASSTYVASSGTSTSSNEACLSTNGDNKPPITLKKGLHQGRENGYVFRLTATATSPINSPNIVQLTDTLPAGITLTGVTPASISDWSCPGLPVTGMATLTCQYIGVMPFTGTKVLDLYTTIEPSSQVRQNCSGAQVLSNEGATPNTIGSLPEHCVDIPPEDKFFVGKSIELFQGPSGVGNAVFTLGVISSPPINVRQVLELKDTLPAGVTLHSISSTSKPSAIDWNCPDLPVTGPAVIKCTYVGSMPAPEIVRLDLDSTISLYENVRENCLDVTVYDESGGNPIQLNGSTHHCVDIPPDYGLNCPSGTVLVNGQCVSAPPTSLEEFNFLKVCETSPHPVHVPFTCKISVSGLGLDGSGVISLSDVLSNQGGGVITQLTTNENWSCDSLPASANASDPLDCSLNESELVAAGGASEIIVTGHFNLPYSGAENCISSTINDGQSWPYMSGHCWKAEEETQCQLDSDCLQTQSCNMHPTLAGVNVCQQNIVPENLETVTIDKLAPKTCKAGKNCTFTFEITNKTTKPLNSFVGITDKPKKRLGRIRGKSKGWSCKRKGLEYRCGIDKLKLKPSEKEKVTLTLQIPKNLSGSVENCASIEADSPVSQLSCVTVEIINDRQCGYDDKLVNGRCVARCTRKNSHWNGIDCMVCGTNKVWNDRYKRCDKKPKKEVIKSCPQHYKWSSAQKRCIYVVSDQPKPRSCNKGTKWNAKLKRCMEIKPRTSDCGKNQRWDHRVKRCVSTLPPKCNKGTHYDKNKKRCVENKRPKPVSCPKGQVYLSDVRRCVRLEKPKPTGGPSSCGIGMIWNGGYKKCVPLPHTNDNDGGGSDDGPAGY